MVERRQDLDSLTKIAEQYFLMKNVIMSVSGFTDEEYNLFVSVYDKVVEKLLSSFDSICSIEEMSKGNEKMLKIAKEQCNEEVNQLKGICDKVLDLLEDHLTLNATDLFKKIFFVKIEGEYYRHLAEVSLYKSSIKKAHEVHQDAIDFAIKNMTTTFCVRLEVVNNFSLFVYEILRNHEGTSMQPLKDKLQSGILMETFHWQCQNTEKGTDVVVK